jgi:hypothetical protein
MGAKSIWIAIIQILWAFDVGPGIDVNGQPITIDRNDVSNGINMLVSS